MSPSEGAAAAKGTAKVDGRASGERCDGLSVEGRAHTCHQNGQCFLERSACQTHKYLGRLGQRSGAEGNGAPGLRRVLEQVPALLNPKGVCAVVLGDTETSGAALAAAGEQLQSAGLTCVVHTDANYSLPGGARVGVWEQR